MGRVRSNSNRSTTSPAITLGPDSARAPSPPVDDTRFVLKDGDTFAVLDRNGDVHTTGIGEEGVFHYGCRYLDHLVIRLSNRRFMQLGSSVHNDNSLLSVDLTNPDIDSGGTLVLPKDTIHVHRTCMLHNSEFLVDLRVSNYSMAVAEFVLTIEFGADFVDMFEVRGMSRKKRGELEKPEVYGSDRVELRYHGLDGQTRVTRVWLSPDADTLTRSAARYVLQLQPRQQSTISIAVSFDPTGEKRNVTFVDQLRKVQADARAARSADAAVTTSNEHFNSWIQRSVSDVHLLLTETPHGFYPYAGIPWFNTPFGRDGILSALMFLWVNPEPARGVLRYLAAMQANEVDARSDAEPGRILHEARYGEMAALNEIPYRQYYGSIDSTPLFVMLADAYYRRTADRELLLQLWPHIERALDWIVDYGDRDNDDLVEYMRMAPTGIRSQGWKDSDDSVFHADGRLAEPPIALCEVQGYVFAAYQGAARIAKELGKVDYVELLLDRAERLRERFESAFWSDELQMYVLALDRDKQPCVVRSSNAGQCLFSGIVAGDRARSVAQGMLSRQMFSGWGIRTVAEGEARYNPMSYHNGSVWPHDNALIADGCAQYHLKDEVIEILESQFQLSKLIDFHRLPELLCGFPRQEATNPTRYPVACSPQAWAAAAVFMLLRAALGMTIDAVDRKVTFEDPRLPTGVRRLVIDNLRIGEARLNLEVERHRHDVGVNVTHREGPVRVVIHK